MEDVLSKLIRDNEIAEKHLRLMEIITSITIPLMILLFGVGILVLLKLLLSSDSDRASLLAHVKTIFKASAFHEHTL